MVRGEEITMVGSKWFSDLFTVSNSSKHLFEYLYHFPLYFGIMSELFIHNFEFT